MNDFNFDIFSYVSFDNREDMSQKDYFLYGFLGLKEFINNYGIDSTSEGHEFIESSLNYYKQSFCNKYYQELSALALFYIYTFLQDHNKASLYFAYLSGETLYAPIIKTYFEEYCQAGALKLFSYQKWLLKDLYLLIEKETKYILKNEML